MSKFISHWVLTSACLCLILTAAWASEDTRMVIDSRGVSVQVPAEIDRVVAISDGLIEGTMIVLGVEDKLVGLGSRTFQEIDNYTYPTSGGLEYKYLNGMNTVSFLRPEIKGLPLVAEYEAGLNLEALASLNPDVVIIEMGSCTFWADDEMSKKALDALKSLDFPVVVLYGTDFYQEPEISHLWEEIAIIGRVFGKEDDAKKLAQYLESQVNMISNRTKDIPEIEKPAVLYFGLSPLARDEGAAGNTVSLKSFESWALEKIVHAKNAFREKSGYWHKINAEQVLAINPDIIVLPTDWGYHPVQELTQAPYYKNLQDLDAIKNGKVVSLPWTPYDCAKRLEYPIEVMVIAKFVYPELFQDIDLNDWLLDFYQEVYGVDLETAKGLRSIQWMDWVAEA